MATPVRFNGVPHGLPGHAYPTPPLTVPYKVREAAGDEVTDPETGETTTLTRTVEVFGWEPGDVVLFDRALAEQHGRPTDNDGADWAAMFVADQNLRFDQSQKADPQPFELLDPIPPVEGSEPSSGDTSGATGDTAGSTPAAPDNTTETADPAAPSDATASTDSPETSAGRRRSASQEK